MSSYTHFPAMFAIKIEEGYRLYTNKIYENTDIIAAVTGYALECLYYCPQEEKKNSTEIRKLYGAQITSTIWTYTGMEASVRNLLDMSLSAVPVVYIITQSPTLFPTGSEIIISIGGGPYEISVLSRYPRAIICDSDPYDEDDLPAIQTAYRKGVTMPAHIKRIIIEDSIRKKESCAISYDEITQENASITSCGHVFKTDAIKIWLSRPSSNGQCPICKQNCQLV